MNVEVTVKCFTQAPYFPRPRVTRRSSATSRRAGRNRVLYCLAGVTYASGQLLASDGPKREYEDVRAVTGDPTRPKTIKRRLRASWVPLELSMLLKSLPLYSFLLSSFLLCTFSSSVMAQSGRPSASPVQPFLDGAFPANSPGSSTGAWSQSDYYPDLSFVEPIRIIEHPVENRLLVIGKDGLGWLVTHEPGSNDRTLFFDVRSIMQGKAGVGEGGISDLAFHPEFGDPASTNADYVYITYRWAPPGALGAGSLHQPATVDGYNRLSRFSVIGGVVDLSTELVMINQYDLQQWHIGGDLVFGNDGFLYISTGDEGNCCDRNVSTQRLDGGLWSGILRIDVDQDPERSHPILRQPVHPDESPQDNGPDWPSSFTQGYFIPNDNPFVDPSGGQLEEFYSIGLRHPWTISFDPATGNLWAADVGQATMEEIDIIVAGGNYQWGYAEGTIASGPIPRPAEPIGVEVPPVWAYPRSEGRSVIGAGVYRGLQYPELFGKYLFSDFISGRLWTATPDGASHVIEEIGAVSSGFPNGVNSYLLDSKGNILMARTAGGQADGGAIERLVRASSVPPAPEPPNSLSQTGAFTSLANLTAHAGCVPYEMNVPFWSDGAGKFRWVCVPNDGSHDSESEQIAFSENGDWEFPVGSVFIKHFELDVNPNDPASTIRLETRFLVHGESGYYGVTYRWNESGTDATLLTTAEDETYTIQTETGPFEQEWHFPGRDECLICHSSVARGALGPNTRQLHRSMVYPSTGIEANQIETLNALGLLNPPIPSSEVESFLDTALRATPTESVESSLSARARSYLDSNCGYCHQPGGVRANFDARLTTPFADQDLVHGDLAESLGIDGEAVLVPGDLERSVLFVRANSAGEFLSMPPLAKSLVDTEGMAVIAEWIDALEGFSVGNPTTIDGAFIDGHHPSLYINEEDTYTQDGGEGVVFAKRFQFFARRFGNPVTPLIVRVDGDNDFTVLAIGTTRTASEYSIGENDFPFDDAGDIALTLANGETVAMGFMDAFPDGSGWGAGTVIPAEAGNGASQDEIFGLLPSPLISQTNGFDPSRDVASVVVGESIAATNFGKALGSFNLRRSYRFAVVLGLASGEAISQLPTGPTVVNGSFESPFVPNFTIYEAENAIPGWTIIGGSVEIGRMPWPASAGEQSMDLNGTVPGQIEQSVTGFVPGATYRLLVDYALHTGSVTSQSAEVLIDGGVIATVTADLEMTPPNYTLFEAEFVADDETALIGFAGLGVGSFGVIIDNVRVEFVAGPDPVLPPAENIASSGNASQSSGFNGNQLPASNAVDGNFGTFSHTARGQSGATWTLEFDDPVSIEEVILHNRVSCCGSRLRDITVTLLDDIGNVVFVSALLNPENVLESPDQIGVDLIALTGGAVTASVLEVSRTSDPDLSGSGGVGNADEPDVLSLAEVEVFGRFESSPPPTEEFCGPETTELLSNGSFEESGNPAYATAVELVLASGRAAGGIPFVDAHPDVDIPAWFMTGGIPLQQGGFSQGGTIELGLSGFLGAEAPDGQVIVEMDGNHHNQLVVVNPGDTLEWAFDHRGRNGTDSVSLSIRPFGEPRIPIAEVSSPALAWTTHHGTYVVPEGVGLLVLTISPTGASDGDIDSSNLLDHVRLCGNAVPVPEPTGWFLPLLGMGWLVWLHRRKALPNP